MGMYTAVWLDLTLTERGFEAVSTFYWARVALSQASKTALEYRQQPDTWAVVARDYPELKGWGEFDRCDFLPLCETTLDFDPTWGGSISEDAAFEDDIGWSPHPGRLCTANRNWTFTAQVKNHGGIIDYFLSQVIPLIAEEVNRGWVRYEEDSVPTHWKEWMARRLISSGAVRR